MALEDETGGTNNLIDLGLRADGTVPVVNSRVVAERFGLIVVHGASMAERGGKRQLVVR